MVQIDLRWARLIGSTLAESDEVQIRSHTGAVRNRWWGYTRIQEGPVKTLQILNRTLTLLISLFVALHHRQFFFLGTDHEFVTGQRANLLDTPLFRDLMVTVLLFAPSYLYVYRYFWFEGKKSTEGTAYYSSRVQRTGRCF